MLTPHFFVGIDPGLSGAIASIDHEGRLHRVCDLPTCELPGKGTVTRRIDGAVLAQQIIGLVPGDARAICCIEDVQAWGSATIGTSTLAAMLATKMVAMAMLDLFRSRIDVGLVPPVVWKRWFGLKVPKIEGKTKGQLSALGKSAARARAVSLYPTADIREARHDGRAEALLIATFARERWLTQTGTIFDKPQAQPVDTAHNPHNRAARDAEIDARVPLG